MKDNRNYYDDFSSWYDRGRDQGYHAFLDRSQLKLLQPYVDRVDVCEIGCGTGLLLKEVAPKAKHCLGIDLSRNMLKHAHARSMHVVQASATELPLPDESFDLVYTFKVLPHVEQIEKALSEIARILRPGGRAFLEFYNTRSLRRVIKGLKAPHMVSEQTNDMEVYTRYDSVADAREYLPENLSFIRAHGIRIVTPTAQFHKMPVIKDLIQWTEVRLQESPLGAAFGGFIVLEVKRTL